MKYIWQNLIEEMAAADSDEILAVRKRDIKQLVQNVTKNVKFHSNQLQESLFFAEIVIRKEKASNF